MSGILRNTLRLASIAKYATNNSTKSLSTGIIDIIKNNKLDLKQPSSYCVIKADTKPNVWQNILAAVGQKTFISADAAFFAKIDYFIASLSDAKICVTRQEKEKKFYLPAAFNIKLNKKSIQPIRTESVGFTPFSYNDGKLYVSRKDGKLTLKRLDNGETLIFNHAVHIEAHQKIPQMNNVDVKIIPPIYFSDFDYHNPIITFKKEGKDEETQIIQCCKAKILDGKPSDWSSIDDFIDEAALEFDEIDFSIVRESLDLQFPMTASMKGGTQMIKIEELGDTFTVYHKIDIKAYKEVITQEESDEKSKIGKIKILLDSGNLVLRTRRILDDSFKTKYEVAITVDFDSPAPSIVFQPSAFTTLQTP